MGNAMAPATDAVMGAVPEANAGVGSALNDVTRNVGGALGIGILGSMFNSIYSSGVAGAVAGLPSAVADAAKNSIGAASQVAAGIGGPEGEALRSASNLAFTDALTVAMAVGAVITLIGAAVVLRFMPAHDLAADTGDTQPDQSQMPDWSLVPDRSQAIEGLSGALPAVVPVRVDK